jgi:SAM-dependent methyltransferase
VDEALRARYASPAGARAYARKYDASWLRRWSSRRETALVARLVRSLSSGPATVLDVPCAAGRLVRPLLGLASRVVAIDASPAMVEVAREAHADEVASGRVTASVGTAESLPFEDGAFDVVVCWRLLHHLVDAAERARILAEVARVSRAGVVLSFADAGTLRARLQSARRRNRRCVKLSPRALADEASAAGLRVVETRRLSSAFSLVAGAALAKA